MEAGTGNEGVAAVPGVLGQPTGACDALISLSLSEMLFFADQIETSAFSGQTPGI